MAIRYQPRQKKWVVYTTLQKVDRVIHNTKRIHRLTKEQDILPLAEAVMHTGAILEEWIPKEQLQGENYDLRVVSGEEEIDYVVVRCSKGGYNQSAPEQQRTPVERTSLVRRCPSTDLPLMQESRPHTGFAIWRSRCTDRKRNGYSLYY